MGAGEKRIVKWDNVRLVLIACVVVGHMIRPNIAVSSSAYRLYCFIYLFHMPAFILVSGLFAKKAIARRDWDKVFGFLVLYLLIKFLSYFSDLFFSGTGSVRMFTETGTAWYALALAAYYPMTMFLKRYRRSYVLALAVVTGCLSGYASDVAGYLSLARIFTFYPFFLAGYYLEPEQISAAVQSRTAKLAGAALLLVFAVLSVRYALQLPWLPTLLRGRQPYSKLEAEALLQSFGGLLRLAWYLVALLLTFSVIALTPARRLPVSYIGGRTLSVYALHWVFVDFSYKVLHIDTVFAALWPDHAQILSLAAAVFLVWFLSLKPFEQFVRGITTPRRA